MFWGERSTRREVEAGVALKRLATKGKVGRKRAWFCHGREVSGVWVRRSACRH